MLVLKIVVIIINLLVIVYSIYFGYLAVIPHLLKKSKNSTLHKPSLKFAILIAARNEENVIGDLIDSLQKLDYPKSMYNIYVIPNNCSDNTEKISIEHGANIIECKEKTKTKGDVLNYVFKVLENENSFDTYAIFDADNIVDKDFLKHINAMMLDGYEIVQGFRDAKNINDSWVSNSYALFFHLQNFFLYDSRTKYGLSAYVNGTGYAFKKDLLKKLNFEATTLTEDVELSISCMINRIRVGYAKKAIFYDEQVNDFKTSIIQRKRWSQGNLQILKQYYRKLFKAFFKDHNILAFDAITYISTPIIQILMFINSILIFILYPNLLYFIIGNALSVISSILVSIFIVIIYKKDLRKNWLGILLFPFFIISWLPICIYALFSKNNNWIAIKHNKNNSI